MSGVQKIEVGGDEDEARLDRWFKRRFPGLGHGRLEKLLRTGQVRVDGGRVKASTRLAAGQIVRVPPLGDVSTALKPRKIITLTDRETAELHARVLYRDNDVLAFNKPAGLAVQGGTGTVRHLDAMLDALTFDAGERPKLVHRLDKDTSGVLLLARNAKAAKWLTEAFRHRRTRKVYWALVVGALRPLEGKIDAKLAKMPGPGGERMHIDARAGKPAVSYYAVVEQAAQTAAWVALMPLTGRTHQLRVHMAAIETPIVGDGKYGGEAAMVSGLSQKLHLHARQIEIQGPGRKALRIEAPLPEHMLETWKFFDLDPHNDQDPFAELEL
jgi:23S rRNA pseudouridine955/2504/2580 synthase